MTDGSGAESTIITALISHGPIGILCLALAYGLRTMWRSKEELLVKYDESQKCRLAEAQAMTKVVTEAQMAISELMEYLNSRRRRE